MIPNPRVCCVVFPDRRMMVARWERRTTDLFNLSHSHPDPQLCQLGLADEVLRRGPLRDRTLRRTDRLCSHGPARDRTRRYEEPKGDCTESVGTTDPSSEPPA